MYLITVNINDKPHEKRIPQSWDDVQWVYYIQALQSDRELNAVLEALTGIPKRILEAMSPSDFQFIEAQCSFFWTDKVKMQDLPVDFVKVQIDSDTWQKLIDSEQEFKRVTELELPQIAAAQLIVKTYSGVDISTMKVPEALAYWDFFFGSSIIGRNDGQTFTTQRQMTTRLPQALRRFKVSHGLRPLMPLRKVTQRSMMRFCRKRLMSSTPNYYLTRPRRNTLRTYGSTTNLSTKITSND